MFFLYHYLILFIYLFILRPTVFLCCCQNNLRYQHRVKATECLRSSRTQRLLQDCPCQEKRISLELSRLCLTINNDRIWLLWNNGGNSFKIHTGFFKISNYYTSGKFKPSAKLMIRQILPVGVILVVFQDANSHRGVDGVATVAFVSEVKRCHRFFLYIT